EVAGIDRPCGMLVATSPPAASSGATRLKSSFLPRKLLEATGGEDLPFLHHERNLLHRRDVGERVAGDGDEVGEFFRLDRADFVFEAEGGGGDARGGADGLHGRESVAHEVAALFGLQVRVPLECAGVGAE